MRITSQAKERTRSVILDSARRLFEEKGFEATTTRDIVSAAGIGVGTLFNYFPTKEALAVALMTHALDAAHEEFAASIRGDEAIEELLFAHAATGLRHLRPFRTLVLPVLDSTLSPLTAAAACPEAEKVRLDHLETVRRILTQSMSAKIDPSIVALHLYWSLYLGVLAFWSRDESNNQEDTLAVLDQSTRMFAAAQREPHAPTPKENHHDAIA